MLLNKNNKGIEEMKSMLGFIWASNKFENLSTDITLVEDDFRVLLGDDLFNAIEEYYQSDDYNLEEDSEARNPVWDNLVQHTQLPIAFYAYNSYASHADLTHSSKGRQIHVSDTEKPAFEWMLERDDAAMIRKANKLTDRLLAYLETNKEDDDIRAAWTDLPIYAETKKLFINSARAFDEVFPIGNSRRFFTRVTPFIREVENTRIHAVLGDHLWDELKTEVFTDTYSDDNAGTFPLIRVPLVLLTMAIATRRFSVQVLPEGIFQNNVPGIQTLKAKNITPLEVKLEVARHFETQGEKALIVLQEYLAKQKAEFDGVDYVPQNLSLRNNPDNKFFRV